LKNSREKRKPLRISYLRMEFSFRMSALRDPLRALVYPEIRLAVVP